MEAGKAGKVSGPSGSSLRCWEGVVDDVSVRFDAADTAGPCGLQAHLPGGVRMGMCHSMGLEGNLVARMGPEPSAATATVPTIAIGSSPVADTFLRADQVSCA
jgi:predicted Abi (CAAX) family protease